MFSLTNLVVEFTFANVIGKKKASAISWESQSRVDWPRRMKIICDTDLRVIEGFSEGKEGQVKWKIPISNGRQFRIYWNVKRETL